MNVRVDVAEKPYWRFKDKIEISIYLHIDNKAKIGILSHNFVQHESIKHIDINIHFIKERIKFVCDLFARTNQGIYLAVAKVQFSEMNWRNLIEGWFSLNPLANLHSLNWPMKIKSFFFSLYRSLIIHL